MSQAYIPLALRRSIAESARYRCGYCQAQQILIGVSFLIEHILPLAAGGETTADNLWLACPSCNYHKAAHTHALDPDTGEEVSLFNPRAQAWSEHFEWSADNLQIIGRTPTGRATVIALQMNNELAIASRRVWAAAKLHPPQD